MMSSKESKVGPVCQATTLQAVNMGYEINGKKILSDVNATFEPRKLTAVMGPSGAGKTTMLNTLAMRSGGDRTGDVLVNGMPLQLSSMRRLLSYMPQDDILYQQLTIRHLLYYAAMMRIPDDKNEKDPKVIHSLKIKRAEAIMRTLGMSHVGDNLVCQVSGGQRKRASAALEFLSDRPLLFMDEPTSGLDAATAKALVDRLSRAAHDEARTVICTIHQPSWELMGKFDRVVLLAARGDAGGTVVYDSKPSNIPNYFSEGGSPVPEGENPADHLMYVLKDQGGDKWAQVWSDSESKQDTTALANEERKRLDTLRSNAADTKENMMTGSSTNLFSQCSFDNSDDEYPISYWDQYKALFIRTLHIWVADPQQGPLVLKMLAAINIILVLLLSGMTNNESKANCIFYWIVVQFAMSMTPLVIIMPQEKAIIMREYRNGVFSATMYWLARFTLAICHTIVVATFTTLFSYPLIGLPLTPFPSKLIRWWCFEFLYLSCVMMLGLTIGTLTKSPLGGLKAVIAVQLPWLVTAGVLPPTSMIRPSIFWMRYPNLFTWSAKLGLTIGFTNNGDKASETLLEGLGYHTGNADSCFQALALAFGITFLLGLGATHYALNKSDDSAGQRQEPAKKGDGKGMSPSKTEVEEKPSTMTNPLLGSQDSNGGYGAVDVEAPSTARSVPIEVRALSYRHQRSPDKVAINNVSLRVEPGSVTVLMGPSGAGKTTLLNLLSGRLPTGTYTTADGVVQPCLRGKVLVDDREAKFDVFKKIGTLTPQDEILSKDLTVRQTLLYTAELRSPRDWTYDKKEARVDEILKKLGLDEKACNVVGDPMSVGISGGQKKRLSIGMDLLAELPVMLVDEPTTGLDASSALSVVQTLITLASDQHRTIICTIHQPPWSMVLQFDKLVLLAGGNLIYDGVPAGLPDFLSDAGFPSPSNENPADYVMTVLVAEGTHKFLELRKNSRDEEGDDAPIDRHDEDDQVLTDEDFDALVNSDYPVSYLSQYTILVRRFAYTYVIDEEGLPETFFPAMMVGIVIGLAFHNFAVNSYLAVAVLTGCVAQGMLSLNTVVLMIPAERELVLREFRNGSYSVGAYWFARATISTAIAVCLGVPLMCVWWSLVGLPLDFHAIFHAWLSSTMNAGVFSLMGCVIGLVCKTPLASAQVSDPIGNAMMLFAGMIIVKRFIKPYALPIFYGLSIHYAFENMLTAILELKGDKGAEVLAYYNMHSSDRHFNYIVLTFMYVAWLAIGFFVARSKITGQSA